jgi:hypothetical protein
LRCGVPENLTCAADRSQKFVDLRGGQHRRTGRGGEANLHGRALGVALRKLVYIARRTPPSPDVVQQQAVQVGHQATW